MSDLFFPGNQKLYGFAVQADKDTPAAAPTFATRLTEHSRTPARTVASLEETDASTQQGASHVTAITPAFSLSGYARPSLWKFMIAAILGDEDVVGDVSTATPDLDQPYYTVWEVDPDVHTIRYDGCREVSLSLTGQSEGDTTLRLNTISWLPLGILHGEAEPDLVALLVDEAPFIFAECLVKYAGASLGRTGAFTLNINRNSGRPFGDGSFRALDVVPGKFQVDGSVTRFVSDDEILRAIDTGTVAGTVPTTTIYSEAFELELDRPAETLNITVSIPEVAYETIEDPVSTDGAPKTETLGFRSQPQSNLADHVVSVSDFAA